jgi:hypothetical protein
LLSEEEQLLQARTAALSLLNQGGADPESDLEAEIPSSESYDESSTPSRIESVRFLQEFINEIRHATLDNGKLPDDVIERLRNPLKGPVDIEDSDIILSLDLYKSCDNASEATYNSVRQSIIRRFPACNILSYYSVKKVVAETSGVISVLDDMCVNSCHAFVGPHAGLTACRTCGKPRYSTIRIGQKETDVPRKQACTIPLGPQIQALRRSRHGALAMRYRDEKVAQVFDTLNEIQNDGDMVYDDIFCGEDFLELVEKFNLTMDDTTVMFSLDGAQLYQNKKSDTWLAIWVITDYNSKTRYQSKRVLPALVIPGSNKPKEIDSFLFRSFHHLSAIQQENDGQGLAVWDALQEKVILSRIFVILATADAVGLTEIDGRVGHHGAQACCLGCNMKRRHKPRSGHYFAAHLRPNNNPV